MMHFEMMMNARRWINPRCEIIREAVLFGMADRGFEPEVA